MPSPQAQAQRLHSALQVLLYDLGRFFPAHTNEDHRRIHAAIRAAQSVLDEDPDPDDTPLPGALLTALRRDAEVFGVAAFRRVFNDTTRDFSYERLDPTTIVLTTNRTPEGVTRRLEFSTGTTPDDDDPVQLNIVVRKWPTNEVQGDDWRPSPATVQDEVWRHVSRTNLGGWEITEVGLIDRDRPVLGSILERRLADLKTAYDEQVRVNQDLRANVARLRAALRFQPSADEFVPPRPVTTSHQSTRGSDVEAWLKSRRDEYDLTGTPRGEWLATIARSAYDALDDLLDDYRLRADTGRSLVDNEPTDD